MQTAVIPNNLADAYYCFAFEVRAYQLCRHMDHGIFAHPLLDNGKQ